MPFSQLQKTDNGFSVSKRKQFDFDGPSFKDKTIRSVFDFAYDMTFGNTGEHRNHRTGGTHIRHNGEIFANTFQGKLAECAVCNLFWEKDKSLVPDFSKFGLGQWDSVDVIANNKKISIKSTKSRGNLLLLEKRDWDSNGRYIPNIDNDNPKSGRYDFTMLIRINPSCEDEFKSRKLLYNDNCEKAIIEEIVFSKKWQYDYVGFITEAELIEVVSTDKYVIHQGDILNDFTRMDADNYYVQAGDMHDCSELVNLIYGIEKNT